MDMGPGSVMADTVGSTAEVRVAVSSSAPSAYPFQRKTWYDGSRYWKSFQNSDATRMEFWYKDGDLWFENTTARVPVNTNDFTVEADSANLFLAYTNGYDVAARSATAYPGTAFSWGSATAALDGTVDDEFSYPALAKDTNSKIWLSARHKTGIAPGSESLGPEDPASAVENRGVGDTSWSGYTNVYASDDSWASVSMAKNAVSYYIEATNFGFAYNYSCTTIDGIKVEVERHDDTGQYTADESVRLVNGSGSIVGNDYASTNAWPSTDAYATYGGSTDTWGAGLTCSDITNSNFGVVFAAKNNKPTGAPVTVNAYVDHIRITVYYSWETSIGYVVQAVQSSNVTDISAWSTSSSIEAESSTTEKYAALAPLGSGDMYAAIATDATLVGCRYDAQTDNRWEDSSGASCEGGASQDVIDTKAAGMDNGMSMVHDETNNYAHLVYINNAGSLIYSNYSTAWSSASTVDSSEYCEYPSLSILSEKNDELYAFWVRGGDLFAVESTSPYTDWTGTPTNIDDSGSNYWTSSGYEGFGSCSMFVEWTLGSSDSTLVDWASITPEVCVDYGVPPEVSNVAINDGSSFSPVAGTTVEVDVTGSVTDADGVSNITGVAAYAYRSGVRTSCAGQSTSNDNNCYGDVTCNTSVSGSIVEATCPVRIWFHAEPTDDGSYAGEWWEGAIEASDAEGNTNLANSSTNTDCDLYSLIAIDSAETGIHYGSMPEGTDTGSNNQSVSITTLGNVAVDCSLSGTDMTSVSSGGTIEAENQKYSLSDTTYSSLANTLLNADSALELASGKPTTHPSDATDIIYWGLRVPSGTPGAADYQGLNTITATPD